MNYLKIYNCLIINRQNNPISRKDCYCEKHHVIPKSEGGNNKKSNLVYLTAREHYIAHLLLVKIYNDWKMVSAVTYFHTKCSRCSHGRKFKFNSHLYQKFREDFSAKQSEYYKLHPRHVSEEQKERLRVLFKGRKVSDETKKKLHDIFVGRPISEEQKQKLFSGRDEYFRTHISPWKGKKHTDEARKKMSDALKGKFAGENNPFYGKEHTQEAKQRISDSGKERFSNPEYRKIASEQAKERCNTPEYREKMSKTMSAYFETHDGTFTGKKHTDETKRKLSELRKEYFKTHDCHWTGKGYLITGENNPYYGKKHTDEERKKMSDAARKRCSNPEWRKKQNDVLRKYRETHENPLKGKKMSDEFKKKVSESKRLRKQLKVPKGISLQQYLKDHDDSVSTSVADPEIKV